MPISAENLGQALNRAKNLMTDKADQVINSIQKANKGNMDMDGNFIVNESIRGLAAKKGYTQPINNNNMNSCHLPKEILESLQNNPINVDSFNVNGNSVLDMIPGQEMQVQRQPIMESAPMPQPLQLNQQQYTPQVQQYQQYAPQVQNGVDYNIIKAIVNECIDSKLKAITKAILNEQSLRQVRLTDGNRIQLVDNKGNLYESTLSFKKNVLKKK